MEVEQAMLKYKKPNIKVSNRLAVYNYLKECEEQTASRPQISQALKLSDPTILKIVSFLIEKEIFIEIGEAETNSVGRKPCLVKLNATAAYSVGFYYDGIQLYYSFVDLNGQSYMNKTEKIQIPLSKLILEHIPQIVKQVEPASDKCLGVGIALPATVNTYLKTIEKPNPAILTDGSLDLIANCKALERLIKLPVLLENDVNAAAYSVLSSTSAHSPTDDFIYMMLGEGIGTGLFLDGKLRKGKNFSAGEIAYMFPELRIDFNANNYEKMLSISSIKKNFNVDLYQDDTFILHSPILISHLGRILAQLIHNIATLLDVECFILGGYTVDKLGKPLIKYIEQVIDNENLRPVNLGIAENLYDIPVGMGMMVTDTQMKYYLANED